MERRLNRAQRRQLRQDPFDTQTQELAQTILGEAARTSGIPTPDAMREAMERYEEAYAEAAGRRVQVLEDLLDRARARAQVAHVDEANNANTEVLRLLQVLLHIEATQASRVLVNPPVLL